MEFCLENDVTLNFMELVNSRKPFVFEVEFYIKEKRWLLKCIYIKEDARQYRLS